MSRRFRSPRYDHPPTVSDLIDASGFGWAFDLGKAAVWLALIAGGVWLRYHVATTALTNAFQQLAPQSVQQAAPNP